MIGKTPLHSFHIFQHVLGKRLYITLKLASINQVTKKESSKNTTRTILLFEYIRIQESKANIIKISSRKSNLLNQLSIMPIQAK